MLFLKHLLIFDSNILLVSLDERPGVRASRLHLIIYSLSHTLGQFKVACQTECRKNQRTLGKTSYFHSAYIILSLILYMLSGFVKQQHQQE